MSQIERLTIQLGEIKAKQSAMQDETFRTLKDKSLPLEDRWGLFVLLSDSLPRIAPWVEHFSFEKESRENLCYCDDFYLERYETISLETLYERLLEMDMDIDSTEISEDRLSEIKEEFLASGFTHFKYDW